MAQRKAYILTCDPKTDRAQFSKNILEHIGFDTIFFTAIPHENKVLSNKFSMMKIYDLISKDTDEWSYVFEDDINILENTTIDQIIEYEQISTMFFYLGVCIYGGTVKKIVHEKKIDNRPVRIVKGQIRGLHAIGISKHGAAELLKYAQKSTEEYMDICLENFSIDHPANVVRYDLESPFKGHRGLFFQDRRKFPSIMHP